MTGRLTLSRNPEGPPATPTEGHAFKATVLDQIRREASTHARLWGCATQGVLSAIQDWSPPTSWADARAILSVASLHRVNAMVINVKEQSLEFVFPEGDKAWPMWVLHYTGDHYTPVGPRSKEHSAESCWRFKPCPLDPLRPWSGRRPLAGSWV